MASHKALVIDCIQHPPILILRSTPEPKEDEVLIKLLIVGLNPHNGATQENGLFIKNNLPSPFGVDLIVAFGNPFSPDSTGTQEYSVVPVWQASLIPPNVSPDEAATFPLDAMTMVFALFHETGLGLYPPFGTSTDGEIPNYRSESIVIIGGGSATGKVGIQLARAANFGNVIVVASKPNEPLLKSLGATTVVERNQTKDKITEEIRTVVGDSLIYAVDCVGRTADGQTLGARSLLNTQRGTLAVLVYAGGFDESRIGPKASGYVRKPILCATTKYLGITKSFWDVLPRWIEEGKLKPTTFQVINGLDPTEIKGVLDS